MAYAFSKEGAEAYRSLGRTLTAVNAEITHSGSTLKSTISQFDFSDMQSDVNSLVESLVNAARAGTDAVEEVSTRLNTLATKIEGICSSL